MFTIRAPRLVLAPLLCAFAFALPAHAADAPLADAPAQNPDVLSGIWWNPNESGWGIHLTQRKDAVFAVWYTYDNTGQPRWLVASDCHMSPPLACGSCIASASCSGKLYQASGARFFNNTFDPSQVTLSEQGVLSLSFQDANNATMSYQVGALNRTLPISRQIFQGGFNPPAVNYTDLWWNPQESGWGLGLTQQFGVISLTWFVYEGTTRPTWFIASNCKVNATNTGCTGDLYTTDGPPGPPASSSFDPSQVNVTTVGTVELTFSDANNGVIRWQIGGSQGEAEASSGSKVITRNLF